MNERFYKNLYKNLNLYEGCGNILGLVPLTIAGYEGMDGLWKTDRRLRQILAKWGKEVNSDSIMIVVGDPRQNTRQGYDAEMYVFEPKGKDGTGLPGGISTMCGNGVRAVASWIRTFKPEIAKAYILTGSGLRTVSIEKNTFRVDMGEITIRLQDLTPYVNSEIAHPNAEGNYFETPIPEEILKDLGKFTRTNTWSIGLNGTRDPHGKIDCEPHVVVEIPMEEVATLTELRRLAVSAGPIITKNLKVFPQEINVNFIVIDRSKTDGEFAILNSTHERNLGSNPYHCVTASCGTGSTVAAGIIFERFPNRNLRTIIVKNAGGDLEITQSQKGEVRSLSMKGPVNKL
jgi:diaminopimelate epimerase